MRRFCQTPAGSGAGLLLSALLAVLPGCGGDEGNPAEPESPWRTLATGTLGPAGGDVVADGITVSVPAGALNGEATLTVAAAAASEHPLLDARTETLGSIYRLSGLPAFTDSLHLRLSIEPSQLPAGDSCLVYVEEEAFVSVDHENGVRGRPLANSVVDRSSGVITAALVGGRGPAGASDELTGPQEVTESDLIVAITVFHGYEARTQDSPFIVCFDSRSTPDAWIVNLMNILEEAKEHLERLGFVFANSPGDKIEVQVLDLPGERNGEFVQSRWGIDASYLVIDPALTGPLFHATVAHELFHMVQMGYGAAGHVAGYDYLWISEASSVWFEPVFLADSSWVATVQEDNRNFILHALETDDPDHGYGASRFLTHITDAYGDSAVVKIYEHIAQQSQGSRSGTGAVAGALEAYDATLGETFTQFAQRYMTGQCGHVGWGIPDPGSQLLTPTDMELDLAVSIPALAAHHTNIRPSWGDETPPAGTLVVTLNGTPGPFLEGFVYTGPAGGGPWTLQGSVDSENDTFTLLDYGRGVRVYAKIVMVNQRATYPYDQTESASINVLFIPAEDFVFDRANFSMRYHAVTLDGGNRPLQGLNGGPHLGTLAGDTFTAAWDSTDTTGEVRFYGELTVTVNPTRTEVTSWNWWYRWGFPAQDVWHYYRASGTSIPQTYEGSDYRKFSLLGPSMCTKLTDVYWDVTEGGEVTEGLDTWSCNDQSYVDFYLSQSE